MGKQTEAEKRQLEVKLEELTKENARLVAEQENLREQLQLATAAQSTAKGERELLVEARQRAEDALLQALAPAQVRQYERERERV